MAYPLVKMEKYDQKFAQAAKGIRRVQCQKILASHQIYLHILPHLLLVPVNRKGLLKVDLLL